MRTSLSVLATGLAAMVSAAPAKPQPASSQANPASAWYLSRFRDFITFGDSYTDENRLSYFASHGGAAPPPGTFLPESFATAGGGRTWARYVVQYTGATVGGQWTPQLTLYNYAVSGAVCSNNISPRFLSSINAPFPDLDLYEVPAFLADRGTDRNGTSAAYFEPLRTTSNAVYSIWDGTNDVGVNAFLTDSQLPGFVLSDYVDCIFAQYDRLYAAGGRFFVLMNVAPLNLAPLYANATQNGVGDNQYWPNKPSNITAVSEQMAEYVDLINGIYEYRIPYEVAVANKYPGANFARFDVNSLLTDIYNHPTAYLNGSAPATATGYDNHCSTTGTNCVKSTSPDSFLWYDELHPSEQTDRHIAAEYVKVLNGTSKYAYYY